jgi:hypothetical protein
MGIRKMRTALGLVALFVFVSGALVWDSGICRSEGIPADWSHKHVIFSKPATLEQARRLQLDPRFRMQQEWAQRQAKLDAAQVRAQTLDAFAAELSEFRGLVLDVPPLILGRRLPERVGRFHADWSFSLRNGFVAQNMSPAKYTFDINAAPSCINDFAVFGLDVTGSSTQANLVALNELYAGSDPTGICGSSPAVYWAYNVSTLSGAITTSPVLSIDGKEVMLIESGNAGSVLHILRWNSADGGTVSAPKTPAQTQTKLANCAGTTSCMINVTLSNTHIITNSSPFYDYTNDVIYVGDDIGVLYKVSGVLTGTPSVSSLTVSTTSGATKLSGPVLDSSSGNIFVGAADGNLYSVKSTTFTSVLAMLAVGNGDENCNTQNAGIVDPPLVDSTNETVFADSMVGTDNTHSVVVQASTTSPGSALATADVGTGDDNCDSSHTFNMHAGAFDQAYFNYNGSGTNSGHLYVCGSSTNTTTYSPELWAIPFTGATMNISGTAQAISGVTGHTDCSPLTEIYNTNSSPAVDTIFFGWGGDGAGSGADAHVVSQIITSGFGTQSVASEGFPNSNGNPSTSQGGTSAIVVDNISTDAQASSIYFSTLSTNSSPCGSGAFCAVKLTQSGLH